MGIKEGWNNFWGRFNRSSQAAAVDYYGETDDYDDEYGDDYEDESDYYEDDEEFEIEPKASPRVATVDRNNKVVSIHTTAQLNVVIFHPEEYADVTQIADCLIEKNTVVLNLENTNKDVCMKIVEFLSGVAYAHKGKIKSIAKRTFIITPYNVGIIGTEVIDELENNGVFF